MKNYKLILIRNEQEAILHGYTGWNHSMYETCAVFVDERDDKCDYDRFKNVTVFAIHPKDHKIVFYGVDEELKPLVDDGLVELSEVTYLQQLYGVTHD